MERYPGLPPLPERIRRLEELACDLWWSWHYRARDVFKRLDYAALAGHGPQPGADAPADQPRPAEERRREPRLPRDVRQRPPRPRPGAARRSDTWWSERYGAAGQGRAGSPTSRPSSRCTSRCRSTRAASACWRATPARKRATSACRWSASGSCTRRATSTSTCRPTAGSRRCTSGSTGSTRRSSRPCAPTARRASSRCRSATGRCWPRCGSSAPAASRCCLLDTDLPENAPWDRELSARLYGGNQETRIQQEIVLGLGGVRALHALGIAPTVWHLNEGHAAFVVLQRIRDAVEQGVPFEQAVAEVRRTTVFTTHTPVPAGHDAFPFHLVETYLVGRVGQPRRAARQVPGARRLRQRDGKARCST